MIAVWPQHHSRAARWARRLAGFCVMLLLVAAIAHRYAFLGTEPFLNTLGLIGLLVLLVVLLGLYAFVRLWRHGDRVGSDLFATLFFLLVLSVPAGWMIYRGLTSPMLNDISTDVHTPPALVSPRRVDASMSPAALRAQLEAYPDVAGHAYAVEPQRLRQLVLQLVEERGWTVRQPFAPVPGGGMTLQADAASFLLRFPADVALRVMPDGEGAFLDMRSASRFGRHDFGDNALRITRFLADLDARTLLEAGVPVPQAGE